MTRLEQTCTGQPLRGAASLRRRWSTHAWGCERMQGVVRQQGRHRRAGRGGRTRAGTQARAARRACGKMAELRRHVDVCGTSGGPAGCAARTARVRHAGARVLSRTPGAQTQPGVMCSFLSHMYAQAPDRA